MLAQQQQQRQCSAEAATARFAGRPARSCWDFEKVVFIHIMSTCRKQLSIQHTHHCAPAAAAVASGGAFLLPVVCSNPPARSSCVRPAYYSYKSEPRPLHCVTSLLAMSVAAAC